MSNTIATEQREKAVQEIRKRFGRHFDDILNKTGVDMDSLIRTASNNHLSRLAHEKEFIMSGSMFLPPEVHIPEDCVFAVRFVSLNQEPGGWNWSYYPVAKDLSRQRMAEGEELKIRTRGGQVFSFAGGSDVAERWRLCGVGFIQNGTPSQNVVNLDMAVLYTPAKWSDYCCVGRSVKNITKRLIRLTGKDTRMELHFRPLSERTGFKGDRLGGFRLSKDNKEFEKQIQILSLGGQIMLTNNDGAKTCVRYDCSENCLTDSLPFELAKKLEQKHERNQEQSERNERRFSLGSTGKKQPGTAEGRPSIGR